MTPRFLAAALMLAICLALISTDALAKQGVLKTKDGRSIEGDITDKGADGATITTKGGAITIARDDIDAITYGGGSNIQAEYQARKAKIPKDAGARDHYELARWLYTNRAYDLARTEVNIALAKDPQHADAALLRTTIERQAILDRTKPAANGGRPAVPAATTRGVRPGERPTLTAEQINIIRQNELKQGDKVNVAFSGDVKRKFVEYDNREPREFNRLPALEQALAILQLGIPEMRKDVRITNDPPALAEYKARIQPAILIGCATANCHGGDKAGAFRLIAPAQNDAASYTNFFILSQMAASSEGAKRHGIDRLYPEKSLIAQFGMPRDLAEYDHPEAAGWNAIYRNESDPKLKLVTDWIRDRLVAVEPDYKAIDFPLPTLKEPPADAPKEGDTPQSERPKEEPRNPRETQRARDDRDERRGNNNSNTQDALDEARQRIRPGGGAGSVPGIGGVGF